MSAKNCVYRIRCNMVFCVKYRKILLSDYEENSPPKRCLFRNWGEVLDSICQHRLWKAQLPGNKNKTIEGTTGFAAGAIFALLAMLVMLTILKAAMATIIESLPLKTNGDLAQPASLSLLYYFII